MSQAMGQAHDMLINIYWGFACSTALFGVTISQSHTYFSNFNDGRAFRSLIAFLLVNDISSTILFSVAVHKMLIGNLVNGTPVEGTAGYFTAESVQTLVITMATQMFFARRVYIVDSNQRTIPVFIVTRIVFMATGSYTELIFPKVKVVTVSENGFAAMSDIIATVAMCYKLVEASVDPRRMSCVVRTLMIYIFNRGIVVTAAQILIVILYAYAPEKWNWLPVHLCVGKLYINTLLAMLNARRRLRVKAEFSNLVDCNIKFSNIIINTMADIPHEIVRMPSHPFTPVAHMNGVYKETDGNGQVYEPRNEP
ncbi:hypothetical protein BD410DRAFT_125210 [Rickenella mellea]|uniref:DUF6534 domain-containing protein n=1 Tax=Rickenella mellea TaxID=50990 RepID=A0A4Y7PIE1_9AGAM|nr:hypothetical protein BD410DRAFT_125210 [Rickenella mellea]